MRSRLACVIPTHNRPDSLLRAIQSVQQQGVSVQILVVDDGSNPPVDRAHLPAEVTVIRHDIAKGPSGARNTGALVADADWIGFLDDDDLWLQGKAEVLLEAADRYPEAGVIFHRTSRKPQSRNPHGHQSSLKRVAYPLKRVLRAQPPHLSGVAVRREIHQGFRFDETLGASEDLDYLIRLASITEWVEIDGVFSRHCDPGAGGTAIGLAARIEARISLMERHADLIGADPVAHSFYYSRLGHLYRRTQLYAEARHSFIKAIRLRLTSGLAWRGLVRVALDDLRGDLRRSE